VSDKCEWCGLTAEHESHLCVLKDDSVHRMEIHLASAPLTGTSLAYIGRVVEEAQKAHPGKLIDITIRHIGHWGKSPIEGLIPLQEAINKPSFITMTHENKQNDGLQCTKCGRRGIPICATGRDCFLCAPCPELEIVPKGTLDENKFHCDEREHYHGTAMDVEIIEDEDCGERVFLTSREALEQAAHQSVFPTQYAVAVESPDWLKDSWFCTNHPPGSEIEVKKGEKCFCGRTE
jgi:hypothetical protein